MRKFKCSNCGSDIYVRHLEVGEMASCKSCGAQSLVPKDYSEVNDNEVPPDYNKKNQIPAAMKAEDPADLPSRKKFKMLNNVITMYKVVAVLYAIGFVVYGLILLIGLSTTTEYGFVLGLIALVVMIAVGVIAGIFMFSWGQMVDLVFIMDEKIEKLLKSAKTR